MMMMMMMISVAW